MLIDLKSIKTYYSTCEKFKDRQIKIENLFTLHNMKSVIKFEGSIQSVQWVGSCLNHKKILEENLNDNPLLVFEDDIEFTKDFNTVLDVPDHADGIYLGKSVIGLKEKSYDNYYNRLFHGLGLHAILYMNKKFKQNILNCIIKGLTTGTICDMVTSKSLNKYYVFSPKKCLMYQNNPNNDQNKLATYYGE